MPRRSFAIAGRGSRCGDGALSDPERHGRMDPELPVANIVAFGVADDHTMPERGRGDIRSSISITVDRPEDVNELIDRARTAGVRVTKEPVAAEYFAGRDAFLTDP
jgi:hypothetical protein